MWAALKELKEEDTEFGKRLKIKLIGQVDQSVTEDLNDMELRDNTEIIPYIPHSEIQQMQQSSQVLLLLINNTPNAKGIMTGKLFEYLASGRPILCIGPLDGDAARILKETYAGQTIGWEDKGKMKEVIKELYNNYLEDRLPFNANKEIEIYSRRALSGQYAKILDKICTQ